MKLDSAVLELLRLDSNSTAVNSHGGGGMSSASTSMISTMLKDGTKKSYFMKTGYGEDAKTMFEGEYASLNAIHHAVPSLCPAPFGWGRLVDSSNKFFLVTDFLDLSPRRASSSPSGPSLAVKMAKLHNAPAPIPEGYENSMFGFPVTTCCGDTPQPNDYNTSWAKFYVENRLKFILRESEKKNGSDADLSRLVNSIISKVVPRLIGDDHLNNGNGVPPVVTHGDLWSGNASRGKIGSSESEAEDVVFDPSACYGHNEYDIGMMKMFGGHMFGASFFKEYHKLCPKTEPVEEYEDRVALYELYHHLNHHALFGGGYRSGAISIMKRLIKAYGNDKP